MSLKKEMSLLVRLAIPVALSHMLTALAGFVDTVMAGHAGVPDLAGVALGSAMWLTLFIAPMGLLSAINPIVGQYVGSGNHQAVSNFMHQCVRVLFLIVLILLLILGLRGWYLPLIIADQQVVVVS
ncbi:MAG: hypothetical protein HKP55_08765, partial [Gammaproteobacteria bacterium]|nr:hypothetical protein [Gammaproteobacteria bacterium]